MENFTSWIIGGTFILGGALLVIAIVALFRRVEGKTSGSVEIGPIKVTGVGAPALFLVVGAALVISAGGWLLSSEGEKTAQKEAESARREAEEVKGKLEGKSRCLDGFFKGIRHDMIGSLEVGAGTGGDHYFIGPDQPKDLPMGIKFLKDRRPIGGMRFAFHEGNSFFKVDRIVDDQCRAARYKIAGSPATDALANWDSDLRLCLGDRTYQLSLGHSDGKIGVKYFRSVAPSREFSCP